MAYSSGDLFRTDSVQRVNITQVLVIIIVTYGLLFVFSALGLLNAIMAIFPELGNIDFGSGVAVSATALIAVVLLAIFGTLAAVTITEAIRGGKAGASKWVTYLLIALVSAALWILLPQLLPKEIQFVAGSAQSMFTGQMPLALLAP